jgi:hypothetical protein
MSRINKRLHSIKMHGATVKIREGKRLLRSSSWLSKYTWFVSEVSVLIFYLIIYWTYLKLQVISFEV